MLICKNTGRRARSKNNVRLFSLPYCFQYFKNNCRKNYRQVLVQTGFTLLEMLVTVAIIATVAGTTAITLKDSDVRSAAAVHVSIMDGLNEGVRRYNILNHHLPTRFDSLLQADSISAGVSANTLNNPQLYSQLVVNNLAMVTLSDAVVEDLHKAGINKLLYVATDQNPQGVGDCQNIQDLINDKRNKVVAGSVYSSETANGCGKSLSLKSGDKVAIWTGAYERIFGGGGGGSSGAMGVDSNDLVVTAQKDTPVLLAVGAGPGSSLFDSNSLGGLSTTPVYRNVLAHEYNRFILLFKIGVFNTDGSINSHPTGVEFTTVVSGAGYSSQEELGVFDGNRF